MTQLFDPGVLLGATAAASTGTVSQWVPATRVDRGANDALRAARDEGFLAGKEAAEAEHELLRRRLEVARAAYEAATTAIHDSAARAQLDPAELAELTYGLTRALLSRELEADPQPWKRAVERALEGVEPTLDVTIRLNPTDAENVGDQLDRLRRGEVAGVATATTRLVADPAVELGGCVAEIGSGRIDAQIGTALVRVARALGVNAETTSTPLPQAETA